jgi:hypothetical protein
MCVFKYKFDEDEYFVKYKACLCAKSDLQHTHQNIYVITLITSIFRALMTIVNAFDLETRQYDAINVFANSLIDKSVYCRSSKGWHESSSESFNVLLLVLRALYELKQSSALWYKLLFETLIDMNFVSVSDVEWLFISQDDHILLFFFVDNLVVLCDRRYSNLMNLFQAKLFKRFEKRCLDQLKWFLKIYVIQNRSKRQLSLCQNSYIDKLVIKFNMSMNDKALTSLSLSIELIKHLDQATP